MNAHYKVEDCGCVGIVEYERVDAAEYIALPAELVDMCDFHRSRRWWNVARRTVTERCILRDARTSTRKRAAGQYKRKEHRLHLLENAAYTLVQVARGEPRALCPPFVPAPLKRRGQPVLDKLRA